MARIVAHGHHHVPAYRASKGTRYNSFYLASSSSSSSPNSKRSMGPTRRNKPLIQPSDARSILIGAMTFLLLQGFVHYKSMHLWENHRNINSNNKPSFFDIHGVTEQWKGLFLDRDASKHDSTREIVDVQTLTPWMEEYFVWHAQQRELLERNQDWQPNQNVSLLVIRCLETDGDECGTMRHRLQSLPLYLKLAYESRRVLFLKWEQPAPLESFLLPVGGNDMTSLDWRLPDWLHTIIGDYDQYPTVRGTSPFGMQQVLNPKSRIVMMRLMSKENGRSYYNEHRKDSEEPSFETVYRTLWHRLFQPTRPLQNLIQHHFRVLDLRPDEYMMLHLPSSEQKQVQRTAMECARQISTSNFGDVLDPSNITARNGPEPMQPLTLVLASSSRNLINYALNYQPETAMTGNNHNRVALKTPPNLLTLDRETKMSWKNKTAQDYYQAFAYLYMFTHGRCVVFPHGDLDGKWGSLLSSDPSCAARYRYFNHRDPTQQKDNSAECHRFTKEEVSPEWIPKSGLENSASTVGDVVSVSKVHASIAGSVHDAPATSANFPPWLNTYFEWHKQQRAHLGTSNWKDFKFLVIRCFEQDEKCGGASDRLQSIPLALLYASMSGRLLFVRWERPTLLEEYLLPPDEGGLDWRLPDWLHENLQQADYGKARIIVTSAVKPVMKSDRLVLMRPQKFWPEFYNQQKEENDLSYEQVFHSVWEHLFVPVLSIQTLIDKNMQHLQLSPRQYVAAHVRAKYVKDKSHDVLAIQNAINCASTLRPGWPIYFTSDSSKAVETALAYGTQMGGIVVARRNATEPLHLDRGQYFMHHWGKQGYHDHASAQPYYDVFVDLYLLGQSNCVTTGIGGYGRLGSMLSYNRTCSLDHSSTTCQWQDGKSSVAA